MTAPDDPVPWHRASAAISALRSTERIDPALLGAFTATTDQLQAHVLNFLARLEVDARDERTLYVTFAVLDLVRAGAQAAYSKGEMSAVEAVAVSATVRAFGAALAGLAPAEAVA